MKKQKKINKNRFKLPSMIRQNFGMKMLSIFIAVVIWLLVANTNDPVVTEKFTDIPVSIINDDVLMEEGYAYEVIEGNSVTIRVKGKRSVLSGMTIDDFEAIADFSKLSVVDAVPIDVSAKKYDDQLEITIGNVNTMKIERDEIVSVSVPVNIVVEGEPADGYAVGNTSGSPNLVKVTGPENLLSNAKEICAEVDINGISQDISSTVKPVLYSGDGDVIDSTQIEMDASSIDVTVSLWKKKKVSIQLETEGETASGYGVELFEYEPKEITIAAPDDVLESLETIILPNISVEGLSEDYEEDIELTQYLLPDNVVLADDTSDVKAKVYIEEIITRTLNFTKKDLTVKGNSSYKVTYGSDNTYAIVVEGLKTLVNELEIGNFEPWIDLSGLEMGEQDVPIHVKSVDNVTVIETSDITVTLKEKN